MFEGDATSFFLKNRLVDNLASNLSLWMVEEKSWGKGFP